MDNLELSQSQEELQNLYAYNVKDEIIFIDHAPSGRKGYFCMGCKKEMQAVRFKIQNHQSYFRHDAQAVKNLGKCTYSDETYRHKIAKEFLQHSKRIKVPAIYKFSPDGKGLAYKIGDSKFIEAHTVANEVQFYEDGLGNIKWGKNVGDEKNLLIKPDVTFFNHLNEPILFIEIVVTHKPDQEKLLKILRLGIDTVSITIPKDSPEKIWETFSNTNTTKWIYNYEQESTEYLQLSETSTEGVLYLDEEQRKLFAETSKCRKAQINNLIRTIRVCLESEQFGTIAGDTKSKISRVERNTKKLQEDIDGETDRFAESIEKDERVEIREFNSKRNKLEESIKSVEIRYRELEGRYSAKKIELEEDERILRAKVREAEGSLGGSGADFENRRKINAIRRDEVERNIANETASFEKISNDTASLSGRSSKDESEESERFEYLNREEEEAIVRDSEYREQLSAKYQITEREIRERIERKSCEFDEAFVSGEFEKIPELSKRISEFNSSRGFIHNLIENQSVIKRNRAIREFLVSGLFKKWV